MNATAYKCPCCGAPIKFDSAAQELKCEYCGTAFKPEQVEQFNCEAEKSTQESTFEWDEYKSESIDGTVVYTCKSCGGEIIGDSNTAATLCPYCGNVAVMEAQLSGILKPDLVIPFRKSKDDAKRALLEFYRGKKLLPDEFTTQNHIESITGIYVPFWLFDCKADASVLFDATNVQCWADSNFNYVKTDHFTVVRDGNVSFAKIPVDGSSKMQDNFMDAIEPFDYSDAVDFKTAYLSGYLADKYDVDSEASKPRANERVKNSVIELFRNTVQGYGSVMFKNANVHATEGKVNYALLPVWILNTKYKGKLYTFAMNGQTGKVVGNLPVDKGKYWRRALALAAAVAIPLCAALWFIGGVTL